VLGRLAAGSALAGLILLTMGRPVSADTPESIVSYDVRVELRVNGSARVTETIAYDFGATPRHGITRRVPTVGHYDGTRDRIYPITAVVATVNGQRAQIQQSASDGHEEFRVGSPDRTVTGRHMYVLAYTVSGVVTRFADHDEFYWDAVGHDWAVPIGAVTVTVGGPGQVGQVACYAGALGSRLGCAEHSYNGTEARFTHPRLAGGEGLSVVVAFAPGVMSPISPILRERHDAAAAFRVTAATLSAASGLALLGLVTALANVWWYRRGRRLRPAADTAVESRPPDGVRPGHVGVLLDGQVNVVDITATIVDLAVRGHLRIRELRPPTKSGVSDWELRKVTNGDDRFRKYERTLFDALFRRGARVRLSDLKRYLGTALAHVHAELYADVIKRKWYERSPLALRRRARGWALVGVLAALALTVALAVTGQEAIIGLGLVVGSVAHLVAAGWYPPRTSKGDELVTRIQQFRRYLTGLAAENTERALADRTVRVWSRYLPYAMVFGLTEEWAGLLNEVPHPEPEDGSRQRVTVPWYEGRQGVYLGLHHLFTMTTGTVVVASRSVPSGLASSSGLSGLTTGGTFAGSTTGGYSGGGAGGGGGGSW